MKRIDDQITKVVTVRRYSDHPVVQKKVAEANKALKDVDLSFLRRPTNEK